MSVSCATRSSMRPSWPEATHCGPNIFRLLPANADRPAPSPAIEIQQLLAAWAKRACHDQIEPAATTIYDQFLELAEPPLLRAVLEKCGRNRAAAAQVLGIHRATLRQKLRKYGIE